jgi:hypothetical protein
MLMVIAASAPCITCTSWPQDTGDHCTSGEVEKYIESGSLKGCRQKIISASPYIRDKARPCCQDVFRKPFNMRPIGVVESQTVVDS